MDTGNFLAFFYLVTSLVWLYRARMALETLQKNPEVIPVSPLPAKVGKPPLVSILLPVKNEEANLADCLKGLLHQEYPFKEIIVINDHSIDKTGEILAEWAQLYPNQLRILNAPDQPGGWTGKNWALAQGAPLARGEWLLFTDADTRHEPWSVTSSVDHAEGKDLDLLSLSPRCIVKGFWEKTIQPTAMGLTGLWFPFSKVNNPKSSAVFGNGQYLMIRKKAYERLGGHAAVKDAYLEDFAFIRKAKERSLRIEIAIGTKIYGTRMYRSFSGIWIGWRRIFLHAFEKNWLRLMEKSISTFCFSFLPFFLFPILTQHAFWAPETFGRFWGASIPILGLIILTAWKTYEIILAPKKYAFLHPLAGIVLTGILADTAWLAFRKKEVAWR